jgi:hypothetical protein
LLDIFAIIEVIHPHLLAFTGLMIVFIPPDDAGACGRNVDN